MPSLPQLSAAAAGNGALTFVPDNDGVVRKVPLLLRLGNTLVPSLVSEVLRVGQGAQNYMVRTSSEAGVGLTEVKVGQLTVPTTPAGEVWVHYTGPVRVAQPEPVRDSQGPSFMTLRAAWWCMPWAAGLPCLPCSCSVRAPTATAKTAAFRPTRHRAFPFWRWVPGC